MIWKWPMDHPPIYNILPRATHPVILLLLPPPQHHPVVGAKKKRKEKKKRDASGAIWRNLTSAQTLKWSLGKEEDSDDSLLEELATVAVKEGSDSDENLSDDEMNKDEGSGGAGEEASSSPDLPTVMQVYEHNPGEVYPIAEEEEEAASPTTSDGVTSLRSRARLNSGYTQPETHTLPSLSLSLSLSGLSLWSLSGLSWNLDLIDFNQKNHSEFLVWFVTDCLLVDCRFLHWLLSVCLLFLSFSLFYLLHLRHMFNVVGCPAGRVAPLQRWRHRHPITLIPPPLSLSLSLSISPSLFLTVDLTDLILKLRLRFPTSSSSFFLFMRIGFGTGTGLGWC